MKKSRKKKVDEDRTLFPLRLFIDFKWRQETTRGDGKRDVSESLEHFEVNLKFFSFFSSSRERKRNEKASKCFQACQGRCWYNFSYSHPPPSSSIVKQKICIPFVFFPHSRFPTIRFNAHSCSYSHDRNVLLSGNIRLFPLLFPLSLHSSSLEIFVHFSEFSSSRHQPQYIWQREKKNQKEFIEERKVSSPH